MSSNELNLFLNDFNPSIYVPPLPPTPMELTPPSNISFFSSLIPIKFSLTVDEIVEDACKRFMSVFKTFKENASDIRLLSLYNHCDPVIQSGPTCGLVALIMCLKLVNKELNIDLPKMLAKAQTYGYTRFGEMFSAENMCNFIKNEFSIKAELKDDLDRSMLDIIKHICQGLPVLLPYDADSNYEPCLKEGTRAHWAVICGFCIVSPMDKNIPPRNHHQQQFQFKKIINLNDETTLCQISLQNQSWKKTFDYIKCNLSSDRLFVYARQGKSRWLQIWNFKKLCKSNKNLKKVSSKILLDPERVEMIYPSDGKLDQSLCNQFILLYR